MRNSPRVTGTTRGASPMSGVQSPTSDFEQWALDLGRWTLDLHAVKSAHKMSEAKAKVGSEVHERLCRARAFINERYQEPIDLEEISREACLSRYHFLRLFREEFATTPHQYLIDRRIEKAKELLRQRRLTVTDVCFEVGFQSLGSFSTLFRQRVGDAPVNYRQRQREAQSKVPTCFLDMYGLGVKD
jgi:AraC-like DNA-binding protein